MKLFRELLDSPFPSVWCNHGLIECGADLRLKLWTLLFWVTVITLISLWLVHVFNFHCWLSRTSRCPLNTSYFGSVFQTLWLLNLWGGKRILLEIRTLCSRVLSESLRPRKSLLRLHFLLELHVVSGLISEWLGAGLLLKVSIIVSPIF